MLVVGAPQSSEPTDPQTLSCLPTIGGAFAGDRRLQQGHSGPPLRPAQVSGSLGPGSPGWGRGCLLGAPSW